MTHFDGWPHPIRPDLPENLRSTWDHLARPGASWTGEERVAVAAAARKARSGDAASDDTLPPGAVEAARLLGADPAAARREWVESLTAGGLGSDRYVELIGVVSRISAVDTFLEALGMDVEPLPHPEPGSPTGVTDDRARPGAGWVPMVAATSITEALSLVPAENAEMERFHGPMYLTFEQMADPEFTRGLSRPQLELVATRTSAVNECFY